MLNLCKLMCKNIWVFLLNIDVIKGVINTQVYYTYVYDFER